MTTIKSIALAAALAILTLTTCAWTGRAQHPSISDVWDRYNFTANGNATIETAYLLGHGIGGEGFTWDAWLRERILPKYREHFDCYPAGIGLELPFGLVELNGRKHLVADQYLRARDGYGSQFGPQTYAVADFTETFTRWVEGGYTDGERKGLYVYLGQLDSPLIEQYAAEGPTVYRDRMREATAAIDAIPGAIVFFDSANNLPASHEGVKFLHERLFAGLPTGIEPRPERAFPHLFAFHVTGQSRSLQRTDPERYPDARFSAANWQIQGRIFEMLVFKEEVNWEHVQEVLDRGNVPVTEVTSKAFLGQLADEDHEPQSIDSVSTVNSSESAIDTQWSIAAETLDPAVEAASK